MKLLLLNDWHGTLRFFILTLKNGFFITVLCIVFRFFLGLQLLVNSFWPVDDGSFVWLILILRIIACTSTLLVCLKFFFLRHCHCDFLEFLQHGVLPLADASILYLSHVDFNWEIFVEFDVFLVLLGSIDHIFVDIKDAWAIYEEGVEPEMKRRFLSIVKLDSYIIVDEQVFAAYAPIVITKTANQPWLLLLLLVEVIKNVAFAYHLYIGNNTTFINIWSCNHTDFVYFLHNGTIRNWFVDK